MTEYLRDFNAGAAYRRAGYVASTDNSAYSAASRLLRNVKIQEAVRVAGQERAEKLALTVDEVIKGFRTEATDRGEGSSHSARVAALAWLGKYLGMFVERHEHSFTDNDADRALDAEVAGLAARRQGAGADAATADGRPGADAHASKNGA